MGNRERKRETKKSEGEKVNIVDGEKEGKQREAGRVRKTRQRETERGRQRGKY